MSKKLIIWLKDKWTRFKKWIIALFIPVALAGGLIGADLSTTSEAEFLQTISTQQATELSAGKYKHVPLTNTKIDGQDVQYEITEYLTPKGEVGYQTIIYYPDRVVSKNVGVETHRNYEYIYPINASTTPK